MYKLSFTRRHIKSDWLIFYGEKNYKHLGCQILEKNEVFCIAEKWLFGFGKLGTGPQTIFFLIPQYVPRLLSGEATGKSKNPQIYLRTKTKKCEKNKVFDILSSNT